MESVEGDERLGYEIVMKSLESPTWHIAQNAGTDGDVVVEKIREGSGAFGYNASTDVYEDLVDAGIIDPALVVSTSLQNAASVAGLMLTTDVAITDLKDDEEPIENAVT